MYSLGNCAGPAGTPFQVVKVGDEFYDLGVLVPGLVKSSARGLLDVLENWDAGLASIERALEGARLQQAKIAAPAHFLAPVTYPSKVICTGTNYYDHLVKDFKITDFDKRNHDVLYFLRHSETVVGPGKTVRFPSQSAKLDWEIELVAVFGKRGRRIAPSQAMSYVAAYSIGLDLSVRDIQFNPRQRRKFDLFAGKAFDDSSPLGPFLVPAKFIDPTNLWLKLWVNDEIKQDSYTREMVWSISEQIAELSQHLTLNVGDALYTGSPAGIGMPKNTYLKVGDRVDAEIEHLGRLSVEIVADPDAERAERYG